MEKQEKKSDGNMYVGGAVLCGIIGALFGGIGGFFIGALIGIVTAAIFEADEATKAKKAESTSKIAKPTPRTISDPPQKTQENFNYSLYSKLVPELLAVCATADGKIEEEEVAIATLLIENDEYIIDKKSALASLTSNIENLALSFEKSKAIFKLKASPIIHQAINIEDPLEKERINILLESLIDAVTHGDKSQTIEIASKIKEKLNTEQQLTKQEAAEQYIIKSGDKEAISMLQKMKKNPRQYNENLKNAAKGNSVMKTALGVFTGMIAANLVTGAIHQYQLEQALESFSAELENIGGIDNLGLDNYETDFYTASDSSLSETSFPEELDADTGDFDEAYASSEDLETEVDLSSDAGMEDAGDSISDLFSDLFS